MGRSIDFLSKTSLIPPSTNVYLDFFYAGFGILAVGLGSGMYISAKWGAGPIDGFTILISEVTKLTIGKTYVYMAILVTIIGYILGGPISVCTIFYSITVGPIIQLSYKYCKRIEFVLRTSWIKKMV